MLQINPIKMTEYPAYNYKYTQYPFLIKNFSPEIKIKFRRNSMENVSSERGKISQIAGYLYYFLLLSLIIALIIT